MVPGTRAMRTVSGSANAGSGLGAAAVGLGAYFLLLAWRLRVDGSRRNAVVLFHYSLAYLALLFVAAAIDPVIL